MRPRARRSRHHWQRDWDYGQLRLDRLASAADTEPPCGHERRSSHRPTASTITAIVKTVGVISVVGVPIEILLLLAAIAALSSILAVRVVASSIPLSSSRRLPPIHSDQQRHGVVKQILAASWVVEPALRAAPSDPAAREQPLLFILILS